MVSGSIALLYFLLGFHGGRQGSGPDRVRSPVEWVDFPSIRTFVRSSVRPPSLGHPARPEAQPARPEAQPARPYWISSVGSPFAHHPDIMKHFETFDTSTSASSPMPTIRS